MADDNQPRQVGDQEMPYAAAEQALERKRSAGDPLADAQAGTIAQWEQRLGDASNFCNTFFRQAKKLTAYYLGYQWLQEAKTPHQPFQLRVLEPPAPWRQHVTINLFKQHVNARRARMLVEQPIPAAVPATESEESLRQAQIANQFLRKHDERWDSQRRLQKLVSASVNTGLAWLLDDWDPDKITEVQNPEADEPMLAPAGEITTETLPAWDVLWEPGLSVTESGWYIRARELPLREIRRLWPDRGDYVTPERRDGETSAGQAESGLDSALLNYLGSTTGAQSSEPAGEIGTVYQGYERLTVKGERGETWRIYTWSHGVFLDERTVEWQPLTPIIYDEIEGFPFPVGMGFDLLDAQDGLNKGKSRIREHFNLSTHPKVLMPRGAGIEAGAFTNEPGEHIEYNAGHEPRYLEAPSLRQEVLAEPADNAQWMGELSGVHEVSQAKLPSSSLSGKAVGLLQAQDTTNAQHSVANFKSGLRTHYRNILIIGRLHYDLPHWIAMTGNEEGSEVNAMVGQDIAGINEVRLLVGSNIPLMPDAKRELVMDWQSRGLLLPEREQELTKLLDLLEWGQAKRGVSLAAQARVTARREHLEFEAGGDPVPFEFHDHDTHIEQHLIFMNSPRYLRLPPGAQTKVKNHYEFHRDLRLKILAEATQEQQLIAAGGMAMSPMGADLAGEAGMEEGSQGDAGLEQELMAAAQG